MAMDGLMMQDELTLDRMLRRAGRLHRDKEIVTRRADRSLHRTNYGELYRRALRLMDALRRLGVQPGDRVAAFGWNSHRYLELYLAVPAMGAVLHTINIRLSPQQIEYLVGHAEDRVLLVDRSLLPVIAPLRARMPTVEHLVVMDDLPPDAPPVPEGAHDYEALLDAADEREDFPALSEQQAATLCYTSGTTGVLKGVLYSHRSIYLHTMMMCMPDSLAISMADTHLQIVPMFHVNGWGVPYCATLAGARLVLPGPHVVGAPIAELIRDERVTVANGVPSVWYALHRALREHDISSLQRILIAGSAAPPALIDAYARDFGVQMLHAWGMTETSPLGTINRLQPSMAEWPAERRLRQRAKQGRPVGLVEVKLVDDQGREQPWDGTALGELLVRGPYIARQYFREEAGPTGPVTADGWLRTGDVATIDEHGYLSIVDRKKDLVKTRGEWLSSVELENAAMGHEAILEAAVVGRPDPLRGEAVVLFVVLKPEHKGMFEAVELSVYLKERFQAWMVPRLADIHIVDALPKTSVGKFDKQALRARASAVPSVLGTLVED